MNVNISDNVVLDNLKATKTVKMNVILDGIKVPLLIIMPHLDIEDQDACDRTFMKVVKYLSENHIEVPFVVFPYYPKSATPEVTNANIQLLVKTYQTAISICGEQIYLFEFRKNPNFQGCLIDLTNGEA